MTETMWAGVRVSLDVAQRVDHHADHSGLPRNVLRAFVLAESDGNPGAVGDDGHSVGLLQLHDQGQGSGMTVAERKDPERNLQVGVPSIARAWRETSAMPYNRARVERVALTSGHPTENIDRVTVGSYAWNVSMDGAARIGHMWDKLEAESPSTAKPAQFAGVTLDVGEVERTIGQAAAWVRAHPMEAAGIAASTAAALLLL